MQDPQQTLTPDLIRQLLQLAGGQNLSPGAEEARFGFAAMEWASAHGCTCAACQLLRRSKKTMLDKVLRDAGVNDAGPDPQP